MNWITDLIFPRRVSLAPHLAQSLDAWRALPEPDAHETLAQARWVVLDVEASGLDMRRDRLISIGAIALQGETISFADSFDIVLKQDAVSPTENILVHGISDAAQREGATPAEALLRFLHYLGKSRLVAYHAAFDEMMLGRAIQTYLGFKFKRHALDLAYLTPALFSSKQRALDDWLTHFDIPAFERHNALSDAYSTAQLFQVSLKQARLQGLQNCVELDRLERAFYELSRMESNAS